MKMKKIALLLAATVGVSAFAACGDVNKKTSFSDYWQYNSLAKGEVNERLEYKVVFEADTPVERLTYKLEYGEGAYATTLTSSADLESYEYKTELTVPVTFTYGGESVSRTDTVTTEVKFLRADKALRPVYSKKTVVSHTPVNSSVASLADSYAHYDYTVETIYEENGSASSTIVYRETEDVKAFEKKSSFNYSSGEFSYVDNEQLFLAFRAADSSATSGNLHVYSPYMEKVQSIKYSFATQANGEFSHTVNGNALAKKEISYREVSFYLDEKNPGATQTARIATHNDPAKNTHRNVLLSLKSPVAYNLGTFVYTLTSVTNV